MDIQQSTIPLIQLIALLFPFLGLLLEVTITEVRDIQQSLWHVPIADLVLVGGGFSFIFLTGSTILLVRVLMRTSGYGMETPFGLALLFLLISLVIIGIITIVFLWGVLMSDID